MPPTEPSEVNLLKVIAASSYASLNLSVAREMFGKSYFALGQLEKTAAEQAAWGMLSGNFAQLTPELFATQLRPQVGFQAPPNPQPPKA